MITSLRSLFLRSQNFALYLLSCLLAGSGILLAERLPRGRTYNALTVLGLHRHDWSRVHEFVAYSWMALCFVHLAMHWRWIVTVGASKNAWKLWGGVAIGLTTTLVCCLAPVQSAG
jgi:Domain of unknown function (DUF4405)